jgi:hypothetical protein
VRADSRYAKLIQSWASHPPHPKQNTTQNYYPECLQLLLIVNANLVFRFIWRIILPFLDPRTREKVQIISK